MYWQYNIGTDDYLCCLLILIGTGSDIKDHTVVLLHCALAAAQCIVIGPVSLWLGGCVCGEGYIFCYWFTQHVQKIVR